MIARQQVEQMLSEIKHRLEEYYIHDRISCEVCVDLQQEVDEVAIKYLDEEVH